MKPTYFLAIDIGASSGRHILGHLENGKLMIEEIYRFKNGLVAKNGHLVWDSERLFKEVLAGLKVASKKGKAPSYIGIDTWGVDYALLDAQDQLLGEIVGYRDARTAKVIEEVHGLFPFANLYAHTGIQFQPFNTIYQLYDDKRSGKLAKAASLLMLPDYLNFRLTGVKKQEYTNATTTGMINGKTHVFDDEILAKLGYSKSLFAPLSEPGSRVGSLRKEIAQEVGYSAEVILPCTHDTASAVMALPSLEPAPYISSGTWSLLGIESAVLHNDEASRLANFTNEGTPNQGFRYQKNIMGLWMIQKLREETKDLYDFAELTDLARANPLPFFVDVNDNRFLAPKNMGDEVQKAVGSSLTTGQIAYCILSSLAKSYQESLGEIEKSLGHSYSSLHIIGGGSQNGFLNELTAKATHKKIISGPVECTAIGNLLVQMEGVGLLPDRMSGKKVILSSFDIQEVTL